MALAVSLPYGIIPKVNDVGEPLEKISEIWKLYESFGVETSEFIPFYCERETGITLSDDRVKVSVYKKKDRSLAILATTDNSFASELQLKSSHAVIKNALTGEVLSESGEASIKLSGFDFTILELEN